MNTFSQPMITSVPIQTFLSLAEAQRAFDSLARLHKFGYKIKNTQKDSKTGEPTNRVWQCDLSGWPDRRNKSDDVHISRRKNRKSAKCGCEFKAQAKLKKTWGKWFIEILDPEHNHGPHTTLSAALVFRVNALSEEKIGEILNLSNTGQSPSQIIAYLRQMDPEQTLVMSDIANLIQKSRRQLLDGKSPNEWLLQELKEKDFAHEYHVDSDGCIDRLFYIHASNLCLLSQNPDIILLDSTYTTNRFNMPMLHIGAVTSDNLTISVGVCSLRNERTLDYAWAANKLRSVFNENNIELPEVIIID